MADQTAITTSCTDSPAIKLTRQDIIRVGQQLPASPQIFARLATLLNDANTGIEDLVALLKMDPGLTAQVIRLSNSMLYGFSEPSSSLEESVGRVGFREVYRLVGLAATNQLFPKKLSLYSISGALVWENSLATALAMEDLVRRTGGDSEAQQSAYTIGLLRSAGKVLLSRIAGEPGRPVLKAYPGEETAPYLADWEKSVFGFDSNEAAAELMQHWKFAPAICDAIRHSFEPLAENNTPPLACTLNIASWTALQLAYGIPGETLYWRRHPDKFARSRITPNDAEQTVEHVRAYIDVVKSAMPCAI